MPPLEIVHYPQTRQGDGCVQGKFLQLILRGQELLLFAETSTLRYHNQILARFLADRGVAHRWRGEQELEVADADCVVIGGGRFRADPVHATLALWDDSHVYGRFAEDGLATGIAAAGDPWSSYLIRIS
jgi:hypothetical protein